ncbi:DinB family protein [Olivibacter sp. SDN3]|uniref:DinB family protein n=1 Tax=Olivibacter sp. SDN3 TaxID=2764720 RepID=UPI0016519695|nr:DinB family protein [Olivibacter sp. SDN3]QNL52232.1 DinB family protein [Olivibacter sp. SDN3]
MVITSIDIAIQTRKNFIRLMDEMTIAELNIVPPGFNNNIAWNFGHILVSQQKLCYTLTGLPLKMDNKYMLRYQRGTRPEKFIHEDEIAFLKGAAYTLIEELVGDLKRYIFCNFNPTKLHYGLELLCIEDAINYFPNHDALHLGFATAIKRAIEGEKRNANSQIPKVQS